MMNRTPSATERLGNALAFVLVFSILAAGAYFIYSIVSGENELFSLGGAAEVRPTDVVIVQLPTLTPFSAGTHAPPETPTPLFQQPTAAPPTGTATPAPTNTVLPTSTPTMTASPTPTLSPTPARPSATPVPTQPPLPTAPPLPTSTPFPTPVPPTPTPRFGFRVAAAAPDYSRGCTGFYIFGFVRDPAGNPLPGLRVRVVSEWGLEIPPATTKTDPPGWYDVLISQQRSLWYVSVVDAANEPLSPAVEVLNTGAFIDGSEACWHQVDFVRVD